MDFKQLPEVARIIVYETMTSTTNKHDLIRSLDADVEFRQAIGKVDQDLYPKEIDAVARNYCTISNMKEVKVERHNDEEWTILIDDEGVTEFAHRVSTSQFGLRYFTSLSPIERDEIKAIARELYEKSKGDSNEQH